MSRSSSIDRSTKETQVSIEVDIDGDGEVLVDTGLPFFDHMLSQLGKHSGFNLALKATCDLEVDSHHTMEDVGITLGEAIQIALGDKVGVRRFASICVPLDEALVEASLDLSGRPFLSYNIEFPEDAVALGTPGFEPQLAEEFFRAFVTSAKITLHLNSKAGRNTHHILEASFKSVARALRDCVRVESTGIPSTKGSL